MAPSRRGFTGTPWKRFREFIGLTADRFAILNELLTETGLKHRVVTLGGNRFFFVAPPPGEEEYQSRRLTVLAAHYDRAPDSPGANDNSAAVFLLMEAAMKLTRNKADNWLIIFTDKEELLSGESIQDQGAYSLASAFRDAGLDKARIFSFDACGTGDTLIISTTADYLLKGESGAASGRLRTAVQKLRKTALEAAENANMEKVLLAPTPFSDDAGFFRAGLAAQTITMLPSGECSAFVSALRRNPALGGALVGRTAPEENDRSLIPETWRTLNTPRDTFRKLTAEHFSAVVRFAEALARVH
jgi:hypothetical protein